MYKLFLKLKRESAENIAAYDSKLCRGAYENKLKIVCGHTVSYFRKLFQTVIQVFMS
jgi:hypothetical protein